MAAYDHGHHFYHYPPKINQLSDPLFPGGRYPMPPPPYVEQQKATEISNDVNLRKETLRLEPDPESPNRLLVSFTLDESFSRRIESQLFSLRKKKKDANSKQQRKILFLQSHLNSIKDLVRSSYKKVDTDVFPLDIKAESEQGKSNVQITKLVFTKEKGEIKIQEVKQILWVNGIRYELQEIYGVGDTVNGSYEGKDCVVCVSQPRYTTLLPCRHWCLCSGCAKALSFQTNMSPVCRQPIARLLEMEVNKI